MKAPSPNHWTAREFPQIECVKKLCLKKESPRSRERLPTCTQVGDNAGVECGGRGPTDEPVLKQASSVRRLEDS